MNPDQNSYAPGNQKGYPTSGSQGAYGSVPYAPPQAYTLPTGAPQPARAQQEHRAAMILTFGLLAWMFCFVFGILAWHMGSKDLAEMKAGRMNRSGEGLTTAGYWLGVVNVLATLGGIALFVIVMLLMGVGSARF